MLHTHGVCASPDWRAAGDFSICWCNGDQIPILYVENCQVDEVTWQLTSAFFSGTIAQPNQSSPNPKEGSPAPRERAAILYAEAHARRNGTRLSQLFRPPASTRGSWHATRTTAALEFRE